MTETAAQPSPELSAQHPSGDPGGYEFLPWSSVERVKIQVARNPQG